MSDSPLSPEEIRAAAEAHRELAPEYKNAVVASFVDRLDKVVDARVEARLATASVKAPARRSSRRSLLTGLAAGACAGGLMVGGVAAVAISHVGHTSPVAASRGFVTWNNSPAQPTVRTYSMGKHGDWQVVVAKRNPVIKFIPAHVPGSRH